MQQGIPAAAPLKKFIEGLRALLTGSRAEAETVHAVKDRLVGLLETPGWLPDPCRVGDPSCYARHLLYQDSADGFVMVAMVWGAGQRTAIHDHAGVWCVEGVYEGRIQVTRFDPVAEMGEQVRFAQGEVIRAGVGACGALIPPVEFHRIENDTPATAISLHVYGRDLKVCNVFDPLGDDLYVRKPKAMQYNSIISLTV
jgi:predicted metal-dependent enzyme (double-stranded beta helix superfamily)